MTIPITCDRCGETYRARHPVDFEHTQCRCVPCVDVSCRALLEPVTPIEVYRAYLHWRYHVARGGSV